MPRLLIVDDDCGLFALLNDYLGSFGVACTHAPDGDAGVAALSAESWDAVVLDVMLPGKNGHAVLGWLRSNPVTRALPVLMLTARGGEDDKVLGLESGADDYLAKPFSAKELVARLRALLRRVERSGSAEAEKAGADGVLRLDDLVIEKNSMSLLQGGTRTEITASELRLLELFAEIPGTVIEREMLYRCILGHPPFAQDRSLDMLVSRLRKNSGFAATAANAFAPRGAKGICFFCRGGAMIRRWWRSLGFYWQAYIFMAVAIGCIIAFVEGVAEPFVLRVLEERALMDVETGEIILWIASVFVPTLALGFLLTRMAMRKMTGIIDMAKRLSKGDLSARMKTEGSEQDVFNQMAGVFNDMAASLEGLLAHERRLLADISHELRSPLARMSVAAALLPMKDDPYEQHATANLLESEIDRMNDLVGMLLTHARERLNDTGGQSRIALSELATESVKAHSFLAADKGLSMEAGIEPEIFVQGQAVRLRTVVDNILGNALF